MIPYIQGLGERIERSWRERSYDEDAFPGLALEALAADPPSGRIGVSDIVDWVFSPSPEFQQLSQPRELFGEPPVLLFQAPRFYVEALFWHSGTTTIHEHGFSGAFAVLAGSSVHSHWRFTAERVINSRMICGQLERVATEILRQGDMRPIHAGKRLIHQLFHLAVPSVTLVVRTYVERHSLPQFDYLPPGLAIDPEDNHDGTLRRRLLLLDSMARGFIGDLQGHAARLIESADLETIYYMFSTLARRKLDQDLVADLYRMARERHGEIVNLFRQACEEERRIHKARSLRSQTTDPEARFLLALLMLMPDRDAIFDMIRLEFPGSEPVTMIETWLATISGKEKIGFELNTVNRLIFRSLVAGEDIEGLFRRLREEFKEETLAARRDELLDHAKALARLDLLRPLVSKSPLQGIAA